MVQMAVNTAQNGRITVYRGPGVLRLVKSSNDEDLVSRLLGFVS